MIAEAVLRIPMIDVITARRRGRGLNGVAGDGDRVSGGVDRGRVTRRVPALPHQPGYAATR
jgi:hypothetical protein